MQNLIAIARLYFIHIFAFLAVGISMYYPPWDIILSLLYLVVIGSEARSLRDIAPGPNALSFLPGKLRGWCFFSWLSVTLPFGISVIMLILLCYSGILL